MPSASHAAHRPPGVSILPPRPPTASDDPTRTGKATRRAVIVSRLRIEAPLLGRTRTGNASSPSRTRSRPVMTAWPLIWIAAFQALLGERQADIRSLFVISPSEGQ